MIIANPMNWCQWWWRWCNGGGVGWHYGNEGHIDSHGVSDGHGDKLYVGRLRCLSRPNCNHVVIAKYNQQPQCFGEICFPHWYSSSSIEKCQTKYTALFILPTTI